MFVSADNAGVIVNPKGEMKGIICSFLISLVNRFHI
jgi:hypothetical protein